MKTTRANSEIPGLWSKLPKALKKKTHHYVYVWGVFTGAVQRGCQMATFHSEFRIKKKKKCVLIKNAKRPPQTKFKLQIMFGSEKIKSTKIAYLLHGKTMDFILIVNRL